MEQVILYTIHCPKCKILENELIKKGISYSTITNRSAIINKGFTEVPMLEVDGQVMKFNAAYKWATER